MASDVIETKGTNPPGYSLSMNQRVLILVVAFLGWMFAGTQMSTVSSRSYLLFHRMFMPSGLCVL